MLQAGCPPGFDVVTNKKAGFASDEEFTGSKLTVLPVFKDGVSC
jgi:hypothetical protein